MRLTLFVPGLLLPREILADTVFDLTAPALSLILGRGRRHEREAGWLAAAFGLDGNETLPAAVLRKVGAGRTAPAEEWLCLDPVHFEVRREGIVLSAPSRLELTDEEATELRAAVQPLLAEWGELSASAPDRWELRLARPLALETLPLAEAVGRPVDPALPDGTDGRSWRRLLAEIQTILHAHPVNRRRDALGLPVVNSLWPWGAGSLPQQVQPAFSVVWDADPVMAGLCAHAGIPCIAPSERFQFASGRVLANVGTLAPPAKNLDALAWREALLALERDWLEPALAALKRNECTTLELVGNSVTGPARTTAFLLTRGDTRRFWRRPRPLNVLA
jgi:hypothetical protein